MGIVDLGCGAGRLEAVLLLRRNGGTVVAVDFSPAMIAAAACRTADPRVSWLCRDVLGTGLAPASADVALCFDAFPRFSDGGAVLREVARRSPRRERPPAAGRSARRARADRGLLAEIAAEGEASYTFLARRPG